MKVERQQEAPLSDSEPIPLRPRSAGDGQNSRRCAANPSQSHTSTASSTPQQICFNRLELSDILAVYGRMVAAGEWRDYAIDLGAEQARQIFRSLRERLGAASPRGTPAPKC